MPFDNSEIGKSAVSCQPLIRQVLYLTRYIQGVKLTFFPGSHLAPKYFKVVANSKKLGHIQSGKLPKSKMASSDHRLAFKIVHVLCFGNELNKELCCRFIFTNLQQSLDL